MDSRRMGDTQGSCRAAVVLVVAATYRDSRLPPYRPTPVEQQPQLFGYVTHDGCRGALLPQQVTLWGRSFSPPDSFRGVVVREYAGLVLSSHTIHRLRRQRSTCRVSSFLIARGPGRDYKFEETARQSRG